MPNSKPILTAKEQVEHLKKKGVKFNVMSEADAERYLMYQSNYFKVAAYRKNWQKYLAGENTGKYMHRLTIGHETNIMALHRKSICFCRTALYCCNAVLLFFMPK